MRIQKSGVNIVALGIGKLEALNVAALPGPGTTGLGPGTDVRPEDIDELDLLRHQRIESFCVPGRPRIKIACSRSSIAWVLASLLTGRPAAGFSTVCLASFAGSTMAEPARNTAFHRATSRTYAVAVQLAFGRRSPPQEPSTVVLWVMTAAAGVSRLTCKSEIS